MASFERSDRVAAAIKRDISDLLFREVKDPRVHFATVTDVEVAKDLRFAKIFVSVMGGEDEKAETMAGLTAATGFLRAQVAQRLGLRFAPEIRFYLDKSLDRAMRINELLESIKQPPQPPADLEAAPKKKTTRRKKSAPSDGETPEPS